MARIEVFEGDITTLPIDAIVNAANPALLGGGGVDGAIHAAAGPELLRACRALPEQSAGVRCAVGAAVLTPGFGLPAKHVIHTVGPIWRGGDEDEPGRLASCYRESLALAERHRFEQVAFPAISCGIYAYPPDEAVAIAVREVREWTEHYALPRRVFLCAYDAAMAARYRRALAR